MALVRAGGPFSSIKGSIRGTSFRVSSGWGFAGRGSSRRRPPSLAQIEYRRTFGEAVLAWNGLSESQRASWNVWADLYGQTADPDAPLAASGRSRFVGAYTMRVRASLPPILSPSLPGIGNAFPALVWGFPLEGSDQLTVFMVDSYPPPSASPATALVYASPAQPLTSASFKRRWRLIGSMDVTAGGPPLGGPGIAFTLRSPIDRGSMLWLKTKVVTDAGNTSRDAVWPINLPGLDELRAFRVSPIFDFLSPHRYSIAGNVMTFEASNVDPYDIVQTLDLTDPANDNLGKLFDAVNALGLWRAVDQNADVKKYPSVRLIDAINVSVTTNQQPSLLRITET